MKEIRILLLVYSFLAPKGWCGNLHKKLLSVVIPLLIVGSGVAHDYNFGISGYEVAAGMTREKTARSPCNNKGMWQSRNSILNAPTTNPGARTLEPLKPHMAGLPGRNVVIDGGTLPISSDEVLNCLTLVAGNLVVDNGATLTILDTFEYFQQGSIILNGSGKIIFGPEGTLVYSGSITQIITAEEFPASGGPLNVICNNSAGVHLPFARTINGSLLISAGIFTIAAGGLLDLDGASLEFAGGGMAGNARGDLTLRGNTGGTVTIPHTVSLRNITLDGTRTLALTGINHINLFGILNIGANAVFDNGGEGQVLNNGGSINVHGKFITRDMQGFAGANTSIPGIIPTLNPGSTIEYALATGNLQAITSTSFLGQSYYNITFSGSGIKLPNNALDVHTNGTVKITGAPVIVDAGSFNIGPTTANATNFIMDGGRLVLGTTGAKPNMNGSYSLTGGIVEFAGAAAQTIRSKTYQHIEVTGAGVGNSSGNILLNPVGTFTVKNGGVFTINDNSITGPGVQTVVVERGGIFRTGNNEGFHGFVSTFTNNSSLHRDIENVVLQPGSTVEYMKSGASPNQNITNTVPYQHFVVSGTGVKKAPSGTLTIEGDFLKMGTGTFSHNNGNVLFNSTIATQNFSNTGSTRIDFYDITNSNSFGSGLAIRNDLGIMNTLTLSGNSKLTT